MRRLLPVIVWLVLVVAGMVLIQNWSRRPGISSPVPNHWPTGTTLVQRGGRPTLIVFAHPMCPCFRSTREVLEHALLGIESPPDLVIEVYTPEEDGFEWSLQSLCGKLKHPLVVLDPEGSDTKRFGVRISGHVLLYDANRRLIFSGGITRSRGEIGPNPAMDALRARLTGETSPATGLPVFGCPIHP